MQSDFSYKPRTDPELKSPGRTTEENDAIVKKVLARILEDKEFLTELKKSLVFLNR